MLTAATLHTAQIPLTPGDMSRNKLTSIKCYKVLKVLKVSFFALIFLFHIFCFFILDSRLVSEGTHSCLSSFFVANGDQQRFMFDDTSEKNKTGARGVIKSLFEVLQHI